MSITLRRVRSFIAVADLGGFRKAADELSVSQSALSAHIRELEDQLGMPLLRRTTRQVRLTENGEMFLGRIRRTLDDFEAIIDEMKEQATIQRGRAIVASVPSIAANVLPGLREVHEGASRHRRSDQRRSRRGDREPGAARRGRLCNRPVG